MSKSDNLEIIAFTCQRMIDDWIKQVTSAIKAKDIDGKLFKDYYIFQNTSVIPSTIKVGKVGEVEKNIIELDRVKLNEVLCSYRETISAFKGLHSGKRQRNQSFISSSFIVGAIVIHDTLLVAIEAARTNASPQETIRASLIYYNLKNNPIDDGESTPPLEQVTRDKVPVIDMNVYMERLHTRIASMSPEVRLAWVNAMRREGLLSEAEIERISRMPSPDMINASMSQPLDHGPEMIARALRRSGYTAVQETEDGGRETGEDAHVTDLEPPPPIVTGTRSIITRVYEHGVMNQVELRPVPAGQYARYNSNNYSVEYTGGGYIIRNREGNIVRTINMSQVHLNHQHLRRS